MWLILFIPRETVGHPFFQLLSQLITQLSNLPLARRFLPEIKDVHKGPRIARERHIHRSPERENEPSIFFWNALLDHILVAFELLARHLLVGVSPVFEFVFVHLYRSCLTREVIRILERFGNDGVRVGEVHVALRLYVERHMPVASDLCHRDARNALEGVSDDNAQEDFSNAKAFYNQGDFDRAISLAEDAQTQAEQGGGDDQLLLIGGALVVVVLLAGGGVYYYRSGGDDSYKLQ